MYQPIKLHNHDLTCIFKVVLIKNTVYLQKGVHVYNGATAKTYEGTKLMSAITEDARRA